MRLKDFFDSTGIYLGIIFLAANLFLYLFIIGFNHSVKFNYVNYKYSAHHFIPDSRLVSGKFNLLNNLGQYDAQWYLRIASQGYPKKPSSIFEDKNVLGGLSYAFFPVYPALVGALNVLIRNVEKSAFFLTNIMLFVNFYSLYFVLKIKFNKKIAIKSSLLLFVFPFSIFFRSYFSETVFLFLIIWFSYFFMNKNYIVSSILLGIMNITRGSAILIILPFYYFLIKDFKTEEVGLKSLILSLLFPLTPFLLWIYFVYLQTNNPFYFIEVRKSWNGTANPLFQFLRNLTKILSYFSLPFHKFHLSKVDVSIVVACFLILLKSYNKLPRKLWLLSFSIWLTPLIFSDLMSFARYQIVSFPLFVYLSSVLPTRRYYFLLSLFFVLLLVSSIFFINWYWVG